METRLTAKVYVDKSVYAIDMPFTYLVPDSLKPSLRRGCRVLVPFGNSNRKVQGLVCGLETDSAFEGKLKPVAAQLDPEPVVSEEMFRIIEYLVRNTFCTYYEAVRTVLPIGANVDIVECYSLKRPLDTEELLSLPEGERRLVEFLQTAKTAKELNGFLDCRQNPAKSAVVKALVQKGIIEKTEQLKPKVAAKTVRMVKISENYNRENTTLSKKQKEVVALLEQVSVALPKELAYLCGVTEAVIRTLLKKDVLSSFERTVETDYKETVFSSANPSEIILSKEQERVFSGIQALLADNRPHAALLYGVTGSGKTQVYLKLIEEVLQNGRTALLLVPEIALTPQLVSKFRAVFGEIVAVIHSSLSVAERLEEYRRIQAGAAKIVIGTRSAVFVPLSKIGIVIMDEEGESSYKSDASPRYHARDIAKLRCVEHGATLLLGSATPSIDSYYRAQRGSYSFFTLQTRYAEANLPQVYLVDMLAEQKQNYLSPLSEIVQEQLALNLDAGEQSIVLINRRGYRTYATCMQCGEVLKCPSCSVAMTYHRVNGCLMCHYCGHVEPFVSKCPSCDGEYIKLTGTGTQKVEEELSLLLPSARILRMDADTTGSKYAYEKNFDAFRKGQYDILLGTQMIAKGLDFPNVTLSVVVNADGGLYSGDYRSGERIFSLITQVVGRSGRSRKPGRAYIQTFDPDNPILTFASQQDYPAFYQDEIKSRRGLMYPPFCDIVVLGFSSHDEEKALRAAHRALAVLKEETKKYTDIVMKALGVTEAPVYRISGKYRYRIIIKCRMNGNMKQIIADTLKYCGKDSAFGGVTLYADVNGELN